MNKEYQYTKKNANWRYLIYNQGYSAWIIGKNRLFNPYPKHTDKYNIWLKGWEKSQYDYWKSRIDN